MSKVSWGILSTARIGTQKVIPAMKKGKHSLIAGIASRDLQKARKAAKELRIPKAYGSYEELLADRDIEAVYNPLPNHLHVEWTLKALEAGKHVLCEKPLGMNYQEVVGLLDAVKKYPQLKVMEAFMYRFHPQWKNIDALIAKGGIGDLKCVHATFSYYNDNPLDIRNQADIGGGGLLDIGCYCISVCRLLFKKEPAKVFGTMEYDPNLKTDRFVSGILDFGTGTSSITCSTQMSNHQRVHLFGTRGRIEVEIPFTPPPRSSTKVMYHSGTKTKIISFTPVDQYTLQGDSFSRAIRRDTPVFTPLEDGVANMKVIDRIIESSRRGSWVDL